MTNRAPTRIALASLASVDADRIPDRALRAQFAVGQPTRIARYSNARSGESHDIAVFLAPMA